MSEASEKLEAVRVEHTRKVTSEQEEFLRRFQTGMIGVVEAGVADAHDKLQSGLAPLLDSWKAMTEAHRAEVHASLGKLSEQSAEQFHNRLENISKQWMLATVTTLDHQSREVMAGIATATEEKLRETCSRVFAGIGDSLRERLQQIAVSFNTPQPPSR
jgi:gas vesicle protein